MHRFPPKHVSILAHVGTQKKTPLDLRLRLEMTCHLLQIHKGRHRFWFSFFPATPPPIISNQNPTESSYQHHHNEKKLRWIAFIQVCM
jgi:hypothetical protein